jgi:uncharacterized protein YjbI with pentapeptide repeats
MADESHAAPEGASWPAHWNALDQPWRTEPEIGAARQAWLAERRAAGVAAGDYPFAGVRLSRADVEWLLATHDDGRGHIGPIAWLGEREWRHDGLDLRGADLSGVDLSNLPLTRLLGSLRFAEWGAATPEQRARAAIHLSECTLRETHLEGAHLRDAHLEGANLDHAYLQGARLQGAHLEGATLAYTRLDEAYLLRATLGGLPADDVRTVALRERVPGLPPSLPPADLRHVYLDSATQLDELNLGDAATGWAALADIHWGGANLAVVRWTMVRALGDERLARARHHPYGKPKSAAERLEELHGAVRANRQLATALRVQGLNEEADRFGYRAQVMQRGVLRRQRKPAAYSFSLFLDALAGYGYRPLRSLLVYLTVIFAFATAYWLLGPAAGLHLSPPAALVLSVSSFHGRGFFPGPAFALDSMVTELAAAEAVVGLLIEVSFIATFTQRFFAR